ncbi:MAG: Bor family protein [Gemmatimonadota bacterium]|jgi:hypothetical protein
MTPIRTAVLVVAATLTVGCYHAIVDTGRQPSGQMIEKPWASSFVAGLVPPDVVETASQCPNGVARVETQHSFLNVLVGGLTMSIYTPMTITVQCAAAGSPDASAAPTAKPDAAAKAILDAARLSSRTGAAVFVDLD